MRPALSDYQHLASGKVRELYRVDDEHLLLVASDRISAYDFVLDSTIPDKGRILTAMSVFFFGLVDAPNHLAGPPDDPRIPDEVLGRAREIGVVARDQADGSNPGLGYIRVAMVQNQETTAQALHRLVAVLG